MMSENELAVSSAPCDQKDELQLVLCSSILDLTQTFLKISPKLPERLKEQPYYETGDMYSFVTIDVGEQDVIDNDTGKRRKAKNKLNLADGEVWYHCSKCRYVVRCKKSFENHQEVCHSNEGLDSNDETLKGDESEEKQGWTMVGPNSYKCNFPGCSYTSVTLKSMGGHKGGKHMRERPFKCPQCDYTAAQELVVKRHILHTHGGQHPYACDSCSFAAVNLNLLKKHMADVHSATIPYMCSFCSSAFATVESYKNHITKHDTKVFPLRCNLCDFKTARQRDLGTHKKNCHAKPPDAAGPTWYHCLRCSYVVQSRELFNEHKSKLCPVQVIPNDTNVSGSTESECRKKANNRIVGQKVHYCDTCGYESKRKWNLKVHIKNKHIGKHIGGRQFSGSNLHCCLKYSFKTRNRKLYTAHQEKCQGATRRKRKRLVIKLPLVDKSAVKQLANVKPAGDV